MAGCYEAKLMDTAGKTILCAMESGEKVSRRKLVRELCSGPQGVRLWRDG